MHQRVKSVGAGVVAADAVAFVGRDGIARAHALEVALLTLRHVTLLTRLVSFPSFDSSTVCRREFKNSKLTRQTRQPVLRHCYCPLRIHTCVPCVPAPPGVFLPEQGRSSRTVLQVPKMSTRAATRVAGAAAARVVEVVFHLRCAPHPALRDWWNFRYKKREFSIQDILYSEIDLLSSCIAIGKNPNTSCDCSMGPLPWAGNLGERDAAPTGLELPCRGAYVSPSFSPPISPHRRRVHQAAAHQTCVAQRPPGPSVALQTWRRPSRLGRSPAAGHPRSCPRLRAGAAWKELHPAEPHIEPRKQGTPFDSGTRCIAGRTCRPRRQELAPSPFQMTCLPKV